MEILTLLLFCTILIISILLNISIIYALLAGLFIFCLYARLQGHTLRQMTKMLLSGIATAKNILIVFVLIGMLTALWRAGGTIATIICYALPLIHPGTLILLTFLLNCGVSLLTGTALGTAATMGVICMTMAASIQANPVFVGGAILAGAYFGDRCSPVSTSALLVSELTGTDIYENIKRMLQTALVPFLLSCAIYAVLGLLTNSTGNTVDLQQLFSRAINLHWCALIPAVIIIALSVFHVNVKIAMSVSIIASIFLCLFLQHMELMDIINLALRGYIAADPEVGAMLNGGGILSMLKVMAIVCISSSYAGIFQQTRLLDGIKDVLEKISVLTTPFGSILLTAVVTSMLACNQTLTIMLTQQLCKDLAADPKEMAINLENTAVVIAPLVPWSIAGTVPLAAVSAPITSLLAACFLYILPAYLLIIDLWQKFKIKQDNFYLT